MLQQVKLTDRLGLLVLPYCRLLMTQGVNNEQAIIVLSRRLMEMPETVSTSTQ